MYSLLFIKSVKLNFLSSILILILCSNLNAQIQYVTSIGGSFTDDGTAIVADTSGNIYLTGNFLGTMDVDPGPGVYNITSSLNGNKEMFLLKLDPNGNLLWVIQIRNNISGGPCYSTSSSIIIDSDGRICVAGTFSGTIDFDPGAGIYNLSAHASNNLTESGFLLKLNASGNFISASCFRSIGTATTRTFNLDSDADNNIYIVGTTTGYLDADPSTSNDTLISLGQTDCFIIKLDSANNYIFGLRIGGLQVENYPDIQVSEDGDIYCSGYFSSTVDLDPGPSVFNLTAPVHSYGGGTFILKLNTNGNFIWAKKISGTSFTNVSSLEIDQNENIYLNGNFNGTVDFDPNSGIYPLTSNSLSTFFIEKIDSLGNFIWVKRIIGNNTCQPNGFEIDSEGGLYFIGSMTGMVDFDMGPGIIQPSNIGSSDVFVYKLDADGNFVWVERFGGTDYDQGNEICIISPNEIAVTGYFKGTATFNTTNLVSQGAEDAFLVRIKIVANKISGKIFYDMNSNGLFDGSDVIGNGLILQAATNYYIPFINPLDASYVIYSDTGSYTLSVANTPDYYVQNPLNYNLSFGNQISGIDTANNFMFTPIPGITDVKITLSSITDAVQGFDVTYDITYKNIGTETVSGSIFLIKDTNLIYENSSPVEQSILGDTITWDYINLLPLEERKIYVGLKLTTTAPVGDTLESIATLTTNIVSDSVLSNNSSTLNQEIKSSYDPNIKTCDQSEKLNISLLTTPEYLTYTIQFQNTGTSSAVNIHVDDKIDTDELDISSFEVLSSSHPMNYSLNDEIVCFSFPNIYLTAQSINDSASHGAVTYRIKTKNSFSLGDTIHNTAEIYFDFNSAIITNTTQHYIYSLIGILESNENSQNIKLFPNPASDKIQILPTAPRLIIRNLLGVELMTCENCEILKIDGLSNGIYLINILDSTGTLIETKKLIKN